jgi:hypothetical protein
VTEGETLSIALVARRRLTAPQAADVKGTAHARAAPLRSEELRAARGAASTPSVGP